MTIANVTQSPFVSQVRNIMELLEVVRTLSKIVIYVTLLVLYLWFYMLDETQEYIKAKTSFATKFEETISYEVPSLVLCPQPEFKPSMVAKYLFCASILSSVSSSSSKIAGLVFFDSLPLD